MLTKFGLPVVAVAMIAFAVNYLLSATQRTPKLPPTLPPAENPFPDTVAGAGIIEPRTENIAIGSPLPGIVVEVEVKVGQQVSAGDPLFRLDDRPLQAELAVRRAMLRNAQAELARIDAQPRPELLPPAEAQVREAQANWDNLEQQWERGERLIGTQAMSQEEFFDRKQQAIQARERYQQAVADYELLKAGAWEHDRRVAAAKVDEARSQVEKTSTDLERLAVRALVDGEVLQVNVRPGEFVGAPPGQALIVLGDVEQLHVRVDIDEYDIPRFVPGASAKATLKGHPGQYFPLEFVRIEPYVVPKRSLTGDNTERVDTRVLQVIYALEAADRPLYVGQQLDVFVDAAQPAPGRR